MTECSEDELGGDHSIETQESLSSDSAIVCYCYRLTVKDLKEAHARCGSLRGVEDETRAGSACTGCKVVLHALFNEEPSDQYRLDESPVVGTLCSKPGHRIMKGFVVANGELESTIYASNAVAPQLGNCDTRTPIDYALVDHRGIPVHHGSCELQTNETFTLATRELDLPRPFYGMFFFGLGRSNFGAARFNIYWSNGRSTTSTHENASSGRPRVIMPFIVNQGFLDGPNTIYMGLMNPHDVPLKFVMAARDVETFEETRWRSELPKHGSTWINANEHLFRPVIERHPGARLTLTLTGETMDIHRAISVYFFVHNRNENLWTCNHL